MSAVETSVDNKLILESHRTKSEDLYVHQDDDIDCYGKIIRDHEILNNRKYEIEDNACKLHYNTHPQTNFFYKTICIKVQKNIIRT